MTIGSILLSVSLLLLVVGFLARPFLVQPDNQAKISSNRLKLLQHKDDLLAAIQALDFEYETGILTEADYTQQRNQLVQEAALILHKFDASLPSTVDDGTIDAKIEAAIAKIRGVESSTPRGICPECDTAIKTDDKFCANCGYKLPSPKATSA